MMAEQYVGNRVNEAKQGAIDWFLKRQGITLPEMPSIPLALVIFDLSAGDTVYDDLIYVQLESDVFVSARGGELKLFTFAGSPKVLDPRRGTKVTVRPNQMVTAGPSSISRPRSFTTADLLETQKPVAAPQVKTRRSKAGTGSSGSHDIPRFNADVVKFTLFESADPPLPLKERTFTDTFDSKTARFIFWHMELDYPKRDSRTTFDLETVWYKPDGMTEYDYHQQKIKTERGKFKDFHDLVAWQTWPGVPGHWFMFKYSWEGQQVEALVYLNPFGPLPWEARFLAADRPLDMAECEEIVRSLTRK